MISKSCASRMPICWYVQWICMLINQHSTGANPFGSCFVNSCFQVAPWARAAAEPAHSSLQMGRAEAFSCSWCLWVGFSFCQPAKSCNRSLWADPKTSWLSTCGQSRSFTGPGLLQQDRCWSQHICYPLWLWGAVGFILLYASEAVPWSSVICISRQLHVRGANLI